jgi:hypothetical protein
VKNEKFNEVLRHFHVPDALKRRLVPLLVLLVNEQQDFLKLLLTPIKLIIPITTTPTKIVVLSPTDPDDSSLNNINNHNNNNTDDLDFVGPFSDLIWRTKECVAAAVHRKNSAMIRDYLRRVVSY